VVLVDTALCYNESMAETLPPTPPTLPTSQDVDKETERRNRQLTITIGIAAVVFVVLVILAVYGLTRNAGVTENIRDIFIIFMALESLVIGAALVVLIVQIASLINLLNNEIKPILDATNETIATLRGTTEFLSANLVQPVVKLNSYLAGLTKMLEMIGLKKK
jgi:ABC-type spermidine/putrescine transport system permease subunit II